MAYVVKEYWVDLEDNNYEYAQGADYPRAGLKPSEERIEKLSTKANKQKKELIMYYNQNSTKAVLLEVANLKKIDATSADTKDEIIEKLGL